MPIIKEKIPEIPDNTIPFTIDDNLFLEMLLMKIRSKTLPYCAKKKREKHEEKENLEKEIADLKKILNDNMDETLATRFSNLNKQLETLRKHELEGLLIRTRSRWIEDGEKPTKYFCSLEKRNFINKTVTRIVKDDGNEVTEQSEILKEIRTFYKNLYDSRDDSLDDVNLYQILSDIDIPILTDDEKKLLDAPLTKDEILSSLKDCKNNKSPGTSGFTAEFFKFFWSNLGDFLYRSYLCSFNKGELSTSQKLGILSILPKGEKPRQYLKNWRPITLLNVSYKILSGAIAKRLKSVLPKIIHENQKGFLSGRYIGENTRLMYDMINICNQKNIPGIILMIDFEKAFDSI